MAKPLQKVPDEENLYQRGEIYYFRALIDGKDKFVSLKTTRIGVARAARESRQSVKTAVALGFAPPVAPPAEVVAPTQKATIRTILTRYSDDGHPDKRGNKREAGDHLRQETASVLKLDEFFGEAAWDTVTQNMMDAYHDHRISQVNPDGDDQWEQGHRTTDLELNTLSNAFTWAVRKELIKYNPIATKIKYHRASKARHAKDVAPQSAEELHEVVRLLFSDPRSEVLGWQALYEAYTGQRTSEAVALLINAGPDEPGHIMKDSIRVRRADKSERENPFCHIHDGLKPLIKAHAAWHKKRYPKSRWFFPGRDRAEDKPVCSESLTRALAKLLAEGETQRKLTGHGMRGFFVLVRRSWGIQDSQIAWEINQIGGVATLQTSYGGVPPHWHDGKGPKLPWLPKKGQPAWDSLKKRV